MAAVDYFLKIDGIEGESQDHKHKGEIEVSSYSFGATQAGTHAHSHVGGGGAGKVSLQDLHFTSKVNKASPKLMLACATGEHIKKAVLVCRKAGKDQQEFLKVTLTDCLVSSYQTGGHTNSEIIPTDQFSLNYAKVEFEYKEQKPDGTLGGAVKGGYDARSNKGF
jgi:type VI secretion system secreted protein Hcp